MTEPETSNKRYFIEIDHASRFKHQRQVCGDTFLCNRIADEDRSIIVLSDGLGSGIKASVLSTLTAVMASKFVYSSRDVKKTAEIIMQTLPVCRERKISYATFTIIDIDSEGTTRVIEYDNPKTVVVRNGSLLNVQSSMIEGRIGKQRQYRLFFSQFKLEHGDRMILFSDGVVQSGTGSKKYAMGWGWHDASGFILKKIAGDPVISATELCNVIANQAQQLDGGKPHDDITCGVIYFRPAREMLIVSGPSINPENDPILARLLLNHSGSKVVCGGTTANIISRELKRPLKMVFDADYSASPPAAVMQGIDLVTEGIITLQKVSDVLQEGNHSGALAGVPAPVRHMIDLLHKNDIIKFVVGTRINEAYQDPTLPEEIHLRRTIINDLKKILQKDYNKEVSIKYI